MAALRILVTNDDGIAAPALPVLASRLSRDGHAVQIAAPLDGYSGCGASIGRVTEGQIVSVAERVLPGADKIPAFSVDAPPAFIVLAALQGFFGPPPDVIVSGPNSGLNLGPLVLHSGTLGAAVTAASHGLPGIALSTEKGARHGFGTAAEYCAANLGALLRDMGRGVALNINVPDLPLRDIAGVRRTTFAPRSLVDILLSEDAISTGSAAGERRMVVTLAYDVEGLLHRKRRSESPHPDLSDAGAIVDGFISVTAVQGGLSHVEPARPGADDTSAPAQGAAHA